MTVAELIEILDKMPKDAEVVKDMDKPTVTNVEFEDGVVWVS